MKEYEVSILSNGDYTGVITVEAGSKKEALQVACKLSIEDERQAGNTITREGKTTYTVKENNNTYRVKVEL